MQSTLLEENKNPIQVMKLYIQVFDNCRAKPAPLSPPNIVSVTSAVLEKISRYLVWLISSGGNVRKAGSPRRLGWAVRCCFPLTDEK